MTRTLTTSTSRDASSTTSTRPLTPEEEAMWRRAGKIWTDALLLRPPIMLDTLEQARRYNAADTLASINALTFETLLNLEHMRSKGVEAFLFTFMAHEIGHHAIAPAGLTNHMRYVAAASHAVFNTDPHPYINLALDLLINTILVQEHDLPCEQIYRCICREAPLESFSFGLMLGAMRRLWGCEEMFDGFDQPFERYELFVESLCAIFELHAEGRRGADLLTYVTLATRLFFNADRERSSRLDRPQQSFDQIQIASSGDGELFKKWLRSGGLEAMDNASDVAAKILGGQSSRVLSGGTLPPNYTPSIVRNSLAGTGAGAIVSPTEIVISYYESLANAHLVSFMAERGGHSELYPESLKEWSLGDPIEEIDWLQSSIRSGAPIPGVNTVAWEYGSDPEPGGAEPFPIDLDIYVDTSGSMPDPHSRMSHIALGAFIFALSVMRQGGAVRVTIWSHDEQNLVSTHDFSTDRDTILSTLCHSIGGGTLFPVKHWAKAPDVHTHRHNLVHTVILSDNDIYTWYHSHTYPTEEVERVMAQNQRAFQAGGTVILNGHTESIRHPLPEDWTVHGCQDWHAVVAACAEVASRRFAPDKKG